MAQSSLWRQRVIHAAIHKTATSYIQSRLDVLAPGSAPVQARAGFSQALAYTGTSSGSFERLARTGFL